MKQSKSKIKGIIEAKKKKKTNGLTAIFVIRKGNAEIIALSNKKNQSQEMYDVYNNSKHTNIVDIRKEISRKFGTPIPKPFPKGTRKNENEKRAKQSVRG